MNKYIEQVNEYLVDRVIKNDDSVLEMLCQFYTIDNPVENAEIRSRFYSLDQILHQLTLSENDRVFTLVCDLCQEHMRVAFLKGMQTGFCLSKELTQPDN